MADAVPISAISRLNGHARAIGGWGSERNAIYAYKTLAALILALDGSASLRFIRWRGACNRCTNGRYQHWDWDDGYTVRCRDCGGTGRRTLHFTETTMADGHAWHHPWQGRTSPGRDIAFAALGLEHVDNADDWYTYRTAGGQLIEWRDPGEWRPNQRTERLPIAEVVPLLNQVEDWVESAEQPAGAYWVWKHARQCLCQQKHRYVIGENSHSYRLDLGQAPGGCFVCGAPAVTRYGRLTSLFHWSLPVCKRHSDGPDKVPFPKAPPPDALITPDIRRWLDRHERIETVR